DQLIVRLKHGYLDYPHGQTNVPLYQCDIEDSLWNLLINSRVVSVDRVVRDCFPGDTIRTVHGETCRVPDLSQVYVLYLQNNVDVLETIERIYEHKAVLYAEPNHIGAILCSEPNDSLWDDQWNLHTPDDDSTFGIGCPVAWEYTTGDTAIRIAIIDDGIDYTHPDLGGSEDTLDFPNYKVAGGYDYKNDDHYPYPGGKRHGTSCAGIAAALTNNDSIGVAGIAGGWGQDSCDVGAQLYAIMVGVEHVSVDSMALIIREVSDPDGDFGCQVLSNSWGYSQYNETIRGAVMFAYGVGASFVAAKGYGGGYTPLYPADYQDYSRVTAVGSFGPDGIYCHGSNCDGHSHAIGLGIDILAPGAIVKTTDRYGGYYGFHATSAATPHVAGSIALIRSIEGNLRNEDTDWILKFSTYDPADSNEWTWDSLYGHGDLRISTAIERLDSLYDLSSYTANGGSIADSAGIDTVTFIGGLGPWGAGDTTATVRRFRITKNITYSQSYNGTPYAWGVGYGSKGWSAADPNYCIGYCSLEDSSQTSTGCTLQTFIYKFLDSKTYEFVAWYPCEPDSVVYKYKVWGELAGARRYPENTIHGLTPNSLTILGNYPNPFNSSTSIVFETSKESEVNLSVYNLLGRMIRTLVDKRLPAGFHSITWNGKDKSGKDLASGIYFYKLEAHGMSETKRLTILK
ncbi:MAG: S8 family serine peptidase, partial [candidate division Zixibacteria bacterium]|nr:S8 family serine peptidase [candidate division Zixibacteria bacterium]